ncbi:Piso0_000729 [Millerozyma farinosa CBS 7064]|uniref:Piso0_000729 protein n=1 Tax=Pichia sorbitophila (strain ATCC MYA-4447 / BCRC 22081 / CBS 7064 / NBRC 10061 / NRRL Y-12695) TaxID=559304 RepID=G8YPW6_PICSO|nr:Piso0_000729 [Millerozyma farinosa CBS 7064]
MSQDEELKAIKSHVHVDDLNITSILSNQNVTINVDHEVDTDEAMILALGYKQEFKREFSLWSVFSVSFSVLGLLPSIASCFNYSQLVIGISPISWIVAMVFICSVAFSMAEVSSAFPTSAGTPYAVSQLTPPKYSALLTWLTCFSNWLCQITAPPSVNYSVACMILALKSMNSKDYTPTNGHIYALTLGIQVSHAFISSLPTKWNARINTMSTITNMIFLVIVFVVILAGNKRQDHYDGISKFNSNSIAWSLENQTAWPTGIAMLQSFLGAIWAMSGYDSPFHLSEECSNASVAVPRAIVMTATCGGLIGWLFMIAISYTIVSIDQVAADPQGLGQPFVTYLCQIMDIKLVNFATSLSIISGFFMGCSCMLAASRVTFAYSRDGLFPLSKYWKRVNETTRTPVNAVLINFFLGQLILLLIFAGSTAVGAIFSVGAISGFVSFTMPTLFKITYAHNKFKPGPWSLGVFSRPIGFISVAFVLVMIPILCFPTKSGKALTTDQMNWTVVVYFGPMLLAFISFIVDAHKWYKGPKTNIEEEDLMYGPGPVEVYDGVEEKINDDKNDAAETHVKEENRNSIDNEQ